MKQDIAGLPCGDACLALDHWCLCTSEPHQEQEDQHEESAVEDDGMGSRVAVEGACVAGRVEHAAIEVAHPSG